MSTKGEKLVKDLTMDEGILNDLLECSVCFERLDTSSKVLPCQHTFCKKCLGGIVEKHKELRCPECRVLVPSKIEDLPPNVLLMRILEGMKNSVPKKQPQRLIRVVNHNTTQIHQTVDHRHTPVKQSNQHLVHGHQPYAKALYDYTSNEPGDLNFKRGDIIILKKRIDNNWYQGECGGNQGVFPLIYVQMITPLPSNVPQCKALYDFRMTNDDEEGCLTFNKSDIITVIRRVDENWAEGKLDDKIGIFPLAFVELNNLARSLMKLSTNSQPGPSKLAPPTPTSDDSTPLIPTDHTRVISNVHVQNRAVQSPLANQTTPVPQPQPIPNSDSSSTVSSANSSSTTPNTSSGGTSSSSSTAPSSPASPPTRTQTNVPPRTTPKPDLVPNTSAIVTTPQRTPTNPPVVSTPSSEPHSSHHHHHHHHREKRHSFTSLSTPQHHSSSHRHSAEILSTENETQTPPQAKASPPSDPNNIQLPQAYVALYPYKPQKSDELELRKGGIYIVTERCQDGWFKGTSNRTQKCGVFPGNYVTLARGAPRSPQTSTRSGDSSTDNKSVVSYIRNSKTQHSANSLPPDLPPRSSNPATATNTISSSWHGQQDSAAVPLGRSSSAIMSSIANSSHMPTNCAPVGKTVEKQKERREKGTVSLMRRLTSIKRPKSPRASSYSMDNPVFEDSSVAINSPHPVHVRSGSCPSQLLQVQPAENHRIFVSTSQRLKHKDRPSVLAHNSRTTENMAGSSKSNQNVHHHRKSNSLDAGNRSKTSTQTVRERFRCIAPYPPNSEYELELQVNDVIYVHKKREDGWYKGTQQRTGRTGLFPASFVESF